MSSEKFGVIRFEFTLRSLTLFVNWVLWGNTSILNCIVIDNLPLILSDLTRVGISFRDRIDSEIVRTFSDNIFKSGIILCFEVGKKY